MNQHIYVLKKKRKHLKKCDLGLYGPTRGYMDFGNERVASTEIDDKSSSEKEV